MSIKFINRIQNYEQLKEITKNLEIETTSDRTLPREKWEIENHQVIIDHLGEFGNYQLTLYFDKQNMTLERVSVLIL